MYASGTDEPHRQHEAHVLFGRIGAPEEHQTLPERAKKPQNRANINVKPLHTAS